MVDSGRKLQQSNQMSMRNNIFLNLKWTQRPGLSSPLMCQCGDSCAYFSYGTDTQLHCSGRNTFTACNLGQSTAHSADSQVTGKANSSAVWMGECLCKSCQYLSSCMKEYLPYLGWGKAKAATEKRWTQPHRNSWSLTLCFPEVWEKSRDNLYIYSSQKQCRIIWIMVI